MAARFTLLCKFRNLSVFAERLVSSHRHIYMERYMCICGEIQVRIQDLCKGWQPRFC